MGARERRDDGVRNRRVRGARRGERGRAGAGARGGPVPRRNARGRAPGRRQCLPHGSRRVRARRHPRFGLACGTGDRVRVARRIESLPPYLFAELDKKLDAKRASGVDVISLGVGDPDLPTPEHVVEAMREAVRDPATHRYPAYWGSIEFREAVAGWYRRRFGVALDAKTEVLALIGSKEGLGHLPVAFVDPGDETLVPDPS